MRLLDGWFWPSDSPHVIFIDSISLDISSLDRSGTRWPGNNASSVPLKSSFEYTRTVVFEPTMTLWMSLFQFLFLPSRFFNDAYSFGPCSLTWGSSASYLLSSNTSIQQFLSTDFVSRSAASTESAPTASNPAMMKNLHSNIVAPFVIEVVKYLSFRQDNFHRALLNTL